MPFLTRLRPLIGSLSRQAAQGMAEGTSRLPALAEGRLFAVLVGVGGGLLAVMLGWWLIGGPTAPNVTSGASVQRLTGLSVVKRTYPQDTFITEAARRKVIYATSSGAQGSAVFSAPSMRELLSNTAPSPQENQQAYLQRLKSDLARLGLGFSPEGFLSAARAGNLRALTLYLRAGMDVKTQNAFGSSALSAAAEANQPEAVKLLLAAGADVNQPAGRQMTPLHRAAEQNLPAMAQLLMVAGAAPLLKNADGWTPLFFAVQNNNMALAGAFLAAGDTINQADRFGATPLTLATRKGSLDGVRQLLSLGAKVNVQDITGQTPLHYAVQTNQYQLAKLLLDNGAKADVRALSGTQPMDIALSRNNLALANLLLAHGARRPNVLGGAADPR